MRFARPAVAIIAAVVLGGLVYGHFLAPWPVTNADARSGPVVALGDSLTEGTGAPAGMGYAAQLARLANAEIVNRGVGGNTTADALRRLDRDVLALAPRIVIVFLGGNDILHRVPTNEMVANLEAIITRIQARGAMVLLVGVQPPYIGGSVGGQYRDLARRTGCVYVPDALGGVMTDRRLMADQIHPNAEGYRVVAGRIHEKLAPYLARR